jgi:hypothetical protein
MKDFEERLNVPKKMTREAFIKKWLSNHAKSYNEQFKDEMREDLDAVIDMFNKNTDNNIVDGVSPNE